MSLADFIDLLLGEMASPLSVGDCIAIATIILKGTQALVGTSEDVKILEGVRSDLERLRAVLMSLSTAAIPSALSREEQESYQQVLQGCFESLLRCQSFTSKYTGDKSDSWGGRLKRLKYSFWGKKELETYRQGLQQSLATLLLLQVQGHK